MSENMRRVIWNFYAWPMTLLIALVFILELASIELLPTLNVIISIPALVALHLHIRNKRFLPPTFWRLYAFSFVAWEFLHPSSHELMHFGLKILLHLVILFPLYVGLFRYAFRDWNKLGLPNTALEPIATDGTRIDDRSMKMSLGRRFILSSIRVLTTVICILIIFFGIIVLCGIEYSAYHDKKYFSKTEQQDYYIVPIARNIEDIENQTQDNVKINYANFEMKLPCKKIEKRYDSAKYKTTMITIDRSKVKFIVIQIPQTFIMPKDKYEKGKAFEADSKILYLAPNQINFFNIDDDEKISLLKLKPIYMFHLGSIYKFETSNVRGFQFINLNTLRKNKYVEVRIFDKKDNQYELGFFAFSQKEIDYTLASLRFKDK
jgi:hypothetical protein